MPDTRVKHGRYIKKKKIRPEKCSNEKFIEAVKNSINISQCGKLIGIANLYHYDFYEKVEELGIDISHFRKGRRQKRARAGEKINRWTLLEEKEKPSLWFCRCDCGTEKVCLVSHIFSGQSKSCGCLKKQMFSNYPAVFSEGDLHCTRYIRMRQGAKCNGHKFEVDIKYLWRLFLEQDKKCAISGIPIVMYKDKGFKPHNGASLDRIDSNGDYTEGNVQWVHKRVNAMKNNMTKEELIFFCRAIVENNKGSEPDIC